MDENEISDEFALAFSLFAIANSAARFSFSSF